VIEYDYYYIDGSVVGSCQQSFSGGRHVSLSFGVEILYSNRRECLIQDAAKTNCVFVSPEDGLAQLSSSQSHIQLGD